MQITNANLTAAYSFKGIASPQTAGQAAPSQENVDQQAVIAKARYYFEKGQDLSEHATALSKQLYHSQILGQTIAPEERVTLDGVTAEYLSHMSDSEYFEAATQESSKYGAESSQLMSKGMALAYPSEAGRFSGETQKPAFSAEEAKSTLGSYFSTLSGAIDARNQLSKLYSYYNSSDAKETLVKQYGEEKANKQLAGVKESLDVYDGLIANTLTSLNIIYSFGSSTPATNTNGVWTMNSVNGAYSNAGVNYQFSIGEDGTITDK